MNDQIAVVADQIANIDALKDGFDAIGFSQGQSPFPSLHRRSLPTRPPGGQFLRAYVERYAHAIAPVHNLITFGSQHMGVSDLPVCARSDIPCQVARRLAKRAVYSKWAQDNIVQVRRRPSHSLFLIPSQAQYFRDPNNYPAYLASNTFLTDINNEILDSRNTTYRRNLASLDSLVLILFTKDRTVVPKESSWFGSQAVPDDNDISPSTDGQFHLSSSPTIVPMRQQPLYLEDWIGLRQLDERGAVLLRTCDAPHMHIGSCWEDIVRNFTGALV